MKHTVHHDLNDDAARRAVQRALQRYGARYAEYAPSVLWQDEGSAALGLSVRGFPLVGRIALRSRSVEVDLDVPAALRPFDRMAISAIDAEVQRSIDEAHRERSLRAPVAVEEGA
ncbi:hypothetical protein SOCEGT47_011560 [Sorangium cellulosum]|jgi:hypothetical protein|uniref:Polyhydroxyalkanoic acid synthase n=1 Tax=Sorangium cellulosum TaxID=56 RepID=A0A4P2PW29_SORCE|nr:polyhydroxyalkanoic acid system family protein [Sorangium cellulosum]AUX20683.1 hypothetical protein SOCEGT47_011560 [Sorangium cellulosum]